MRRHLSLFPLLFAWLLATGSQWDLVQTLAWGRMFTQYARTMPLSQAARLTFAPTNMCGMCKAVNAAQHENDRNKPELKAPGKILLALVPAPMFVLAMPAPGRTLTATRALVSADPSAPPSPPPRGSA